ncbi:MAG: hypothetical protein ABFC96_15435 [Thermoguttaceae bacterium]
MERHRFALPLFVGVLSVCAAALGQYPSTGADAGPALSPPAAQQPGWPPSQPATSAAAAYAPPAPQAPAPPSPEQPGWPPSTPTPTPAASPSLSAPPGRSLYDNPPLGPTAGSTLGSIPGCSGPRWDIAVDALWLSRTTDRGVHLGWSDYNPQSGVHQQILTHDLWSDDELFPLAPGLRVQAAGQVTDYMSIEAIGFGLQEWSVGRTIYGDADQYSVLTYSPWLQVPVILNDGMDNALGYTDKSLVANVELNQRFKVNPYDPFRQLSFLWGVRYFHLSDDFTLSGSDLYNGYAENLEYKTLNNLIGLQVGLQGGWTWDRFQLTAEAKIGLYANIYSQHGSDTGTGAGFLAYEDSHSGTDLSALFEFSLMGRYRITENFWVRGGYQFYTAGGLALGPRQLAGNDTGGCIGLDGLSIGVEYTH